MGLGSFVRPVASPSYYKTATLLDSLRRRLRLVALDPYPVFVLARLCQVIGSLPAQPEIREPDGDSLTYSVGGTDAAKFNRVFALNASTGEIVAKPGATVDFESKSSYSLTVSVTDGEDASGSTESVPTTDDTAHVSIRVTNIDEPGSISLSTTEPRTPAAAATAYICPLPSRGSSSRTSHIYPLSPPSGSSRTSPSTIAAAGASPNTMFICGCTPGFWPVFLSLNMPRYFASESSAFCLS